MKLFKHYSILLSSNLSAVVVAVADAVADALAAAAVVDAAAMTIPRSHHT